MQHPHPPRLSGAATSPSLRLRHHASAAGEVHLPRLSLVRSGRDTIKSPGAVFLDDRVAEHQQVHPAAHEGAERLRQRIDDWLAAEIERGVEQHRYAGRRTEARDQPVEERVRLPANRLEAAAAACGTTALLYVFSFFVTREAQLLRTRVAAPLLSCGRHSLAVFGAGVVLSSCGYMAINESGGAPAAHAAVNLGGIVALFALAGVLDRYRKRRSRAAASPIDVWNSKLERN